MNDLINVFEGIKTLITSFSHIQRDALHIHVGLVLFLVLSGLFRGPRRFRYALLVTAGLCLLGEVFDTAHSVDIGRRILWFDSCKDVFNTLFWPVLLYLLGPRLARWLGLGVSAEPMSVDAHGKPGGARRPL